MWDEGRGWPLTLPSAHFDGCWLNRSTVRMEIRRKTDLASRLSRPLKVIGNDKDRSETYDFLLAFHSNHWPILCHFQYRPIARYWPKLQIFLNPRLFDAPPGRSNWMTPILAHKLEWWGYQIEKKFDGILSHFNTIQEWRTDGHRSTASTALMHSVAW